MIVDPTQPVRLRKMVIDPKTGNTYIPYDRAYLPGELPVHLINDVNCIQDGEAELVHVPIEEVRVIQPSSVEHLSSTIPTNKLGTETQEVVKPINKGAR